MSRGRACTRSTRTSPRDGARTESSTRRSPDCWPAFMGWRRNRISPNFGWDGQADSLERIRIGFRHTANAQLSQRDSSTSVVTSVASGSGRRRRGNRNAAILPRRKRSAAPLWLLRGTQKLLQCRFGESSGRAPDELSFGIHQQDVGVIRIAVSGDLFPCFFSV
jgi:hypothetical protein